MSKTSGIVFSGKRYWSPPGSAAPAAALPDTSRFKNNGTFVNHTHYDQLPSGLWVASFDNGNDDYVQLGTPVSIQGLLTQLTLEAWVCPLQIVNDAGIMGNLNTWSGGFMLCQRNTGGGVVHFGFRFVTSLGVADDSFLSGSIGQWQHFVGTFNSLGGANNQKSYIQGVLASQHTVAASILPPVPSFTIGKSGNYSSYFGSVGLQRIYSYALSADEINRRFEAERRFFGV